jgi:hypothetical protein
MAQKQPIDTYHFSIVIGAFEQQSDSAFSAVCLIGGLSMLLVDSQVFLAQILTFFVNLLMKWVKMQPVVKTPK